jgi:hypothetical protein
MVLRSDQGELPDNGYLETYGTRCGHPVVLVALIGGVAWLATVAVVLGACTSAAEGDRLVRGRRRPARLGPGEGQWLTLQALPARNTCRIVRSSSLMSAQSDHPVT